jgi:hypothetical protein
MTRRGQTDAGDEDRPVFLAEALTLVPFSETTRRRASGDQLGRARRRYTCAPAALDVLAVPTGLVSPDATGALDGAAIAILEAQRR